MRAKMLLRLPLWLALVGAVARSDAQGFLVIGHPQTPKMDLATLEKVFTGKLIDVRGVAVTPVNARPGSAARKKFLREVLNQDDERYIAYWTVRRYIGKGSPPRELPSAAAVVDFVKSTPGAVGYVESDAAVVGVNVILSNLDP